MQTHATDFWKNQDNATEVSQRISEIKEEIYTVESLKKELADLKELNELGQVNPSSFALIEPDGSQTFVPSTQSRGSRMASGQVKLIDELKKKIEKEELKTF